MLIRKIKYRWLLAWCWAIDVYLHHHGGDQALLPAGTAVLNTVNELLKFFFLVEGKPSPTTSSLYRWLARRASAGSLSPPP